MSISKNKKVALVPIVDVICLTGGKCGSSTLYTFEHLHLWTFKTPIL